MKKKSESAEKLDREVQDAISNADHFIVSIYHDGGYRKEPVRSLEIALRVCPLLESSLQSSRRAMIYAITKNGASVMIPRPAG